MTLLFAAAAAVIATVSIPALNESSGLAASRRHPGVFWTHNDSGGGPWLYAFDRSGRSRGRWRVRNARANDWEDMAAGPAGMLYIGDIGDNKASRSFITVYRVPEPDLNNKGGETAPAEAFRFRYPDGPRDAECLMVHPVTGDLYIVTKREDAVYKASAPLKAGAPVTLRRIASVPFPGSSLLGAITGRATGGDISPDGKRVVVCDYFSGYEKVLPRGSRNFDDIWKAPWTRVDLGTRRQGEAVAYRHDGQTILATSEGAAFPLIEITFR